MKLFKLTDNENCTHSNTQWSEGFTLTLPVVKNPILCTPKVIHAYKNINLAFLLNNAHANFTDPNVWEAKGDVCVEDWGKVGCFKLTTIRQLAKPRWVESSQSLYERKVQLQFAILCAEAVLPIFEKHSPSDSRPRKAIEAAKVFLNIDTDIARTARAAARAAAYADACAAAYAAADAAADAAYTTANYAAHDAAHDAARAASAYAARAASACAANARAASAHAAVYAARAARAATFSNTVNIDFCKLADLAVEMVMKK